MNVKSVLSLVLLAASPSLSGQTQPQSRIIAPLDESRLVPLRGNVHPLAQARFDRGPAPLSMPTGPLLLLLQRSSDQQQALTQYLADVQNPGSPTYHQWLTPAQYSARFGMADADLQTVETWLRSHGLKIERISGARNVIQFSGDVSAVQDAFHTSIHTFQIHNTTRFANVTDPQVPAALAPVVAGISPLNSFHPQPDFVAGPRGSWNTTTHRIQPSLTLQDTNNHFYLFVDPADAATIYDTPNRYLNANYSGTTWDGTGVNIGILGVSDLTIADVQNYREAFLGETAGSVNLPTQVIDGNDPGLIPGSAADEALLDNEIAGGIAPKARIYYYTAADTDLSSGLLSAAFRAIDDNTVSILSVSFGECESALGTSGNQLLLEAAQQAAAQGISLVVSAGDNGSAGCDDFDTQSVARLGFAVNGFASTPYTVAVGGTDFDTVYSSFATYVDTTSSGTSPYYRTALSYIPENPWNDATTGNTALSNNVPYLDSQGNGDIIAGSGGVSSVYAKPSWQNSITPADNARDLPDVSFLAGNGFYNAMWAFCGDSASDGNTSGSAYTACQTSGGQFTASTVFQGAGGTSAAAPAFAGMLALVSQSQGGARLGQPNPVLYRLAATKYATVFHDVTVGNNSVPCATGSPNCGSSGFLTGYDASTGYDLASGLGSVDLAKLIQNWTSVSLASTTTTLNIGGSTASYTGVHGASLTFNVAVSGSGATPTGNVAIIDTANQTAGGTSSGPQNNGQIVIPLASGSGTATYNGLPGGNYTVQARYGGDASNAASTSAPVSVNISPEASTTTLQVVGYNAVTGAPIGGTSLRYGSIVIADATIQGTAEGAGTQGLATGTVTFSNGSTTLGTAAIGSSNIASWPSLGGKLAIPSPGTYSYTAAYSGDSSYNSSTSAAVPFTIAKGVTTLAITNYPTTVIGVYGSSSSTSILVTIETPFTLGAAPGGSLAVSVNGRPATTLTNLMATSQGSGGSAKWVITTSVSVPFSLFQSGSNTITADYSGDGNYASSTQAVDVTDTDGIGSFSMTGSGDISVIAGLQADEKLAFTPSGGFDDAVGVTISGVPAGVTVWGTNSLANFSNGKGGFYLVGTVSYADLVMSTPFNAAPGTYPIVVTATDPTGKDLQSFTFNLIINGIAPNASIALANGGPVSMPAGALNNNTANVTITPLNGYIGELNESCVITTAMSGAVVPPTCGGGSSVIDVTSASPEIQVVSIGTSQTTTPGSYTVTITATDKYNSSITATTSFPLTIAPAMAVSVSSSGDIVTSPNATTGNTSTLTITPTGGFIGTVNFLCRVSSPADLGCDVAPSTVSISGQTPATTTLIVSSYPTSSSGKYTVTVEYSANSSAGTIQASTTVGVTIQNTPTFALSSSANIAIKPGATTGNTAIITVTPSNNFLGAVYLSCSVSTSLAGAADMPTCFIPSSVSITGPAAVTATLSVTTTAPGSAMLDRPWRKFLFGGGSAVLALMVFFGIPARRRAWRGMLTLLLVMVMTSAIVACGGGGGGAGAGSGAGTGGGGQTLPGTTPGTYTITVKAADAATGQITASTNVTLTVNKN